MAMTQEEHIVQLEKENAEPGAALVAVYERLERVEKLLAKERHKISTPVILMLSSTPIASLR